MDKYALLLRHRHNDIETFGSIFLHESPNEVAFQCPTLELPWRNNEPFHSCIPDTPGMDSYTLKLRWSKTHKQHFAVSGVPGRTDILIHPGNFFHDTEGCILPGSGYRDIDGDGKMDVINSRTTLDRMIAAFVSMVGRDGELPLRVISADGEIRLEVLNV